MICLKHNKEIIGVIGAKSLCDECKIEMEENELAEAKFTTMRIVTGIISFFTWMFIIRLDYGHWDFIVPFFAALLGPLNLVIFPFIILEICFSY